MTVRIVALAIMMAVGGANHCARGTGFLVLVAREKSQSIKKSAVHQGVHVKCRSASQENRLVCIKYLFVSEIDKKG